ncbi:MAG: regulatory protein RecX [Xanthomonadales bacterium]|jgi:regulatory protein|nr:regulatory protein RecX [Xanthomonadales bacterium]
MALRYLGRREHSVAELEGKLRQRGVQGEALEEAMAFLLDHDLVSDERYAEAWARSRVQKGYGPARIRAELRRKGVSDALVAQALEPYDEAWYDEALRWAERKHRGALDEKARARLYRGGMNRGFSHDQVMRAIDALRSET